MLYNDPTYGPGAGSAYGQLGIYGTDSNAPALKNSVAVEFDNVWSNTYADPATSTPGSHVAITNPGVSSTSTRVPHYAMSQLPTTYANNSINTVRVTWSLTDPGSTDALTDNSYTLAYSYYQGSGTAAGTPTVTGSKSYTYTEMLAMFGGTSTVRMGLSGTTAADGTQTTTAVSGLTSKTGSLRPPPPSS